MSTVTLAPFTVVGIEARTSNQREMSPEGIIPLVWARIMQATIPHRADNDLVALYTDYESDHNGAYTFILGAKVCEVGELHEGMVVKQVPGAAYTIYDVPPGPPQTVVARTWQKIWTDETLNRAFTTDFELYTDRKIQIHIATKS